MGELYIDAAGGVHRDAETDQSGTPLRVRTVAGRIAVGIGDWTGHTASPAYLAAVETGRRQARELERRGHGLPETVSAAELARLIARLVADGEAVSQAQQRILHYVLVEGLPIGWAVDAVIDAPGASRRNARRRTQRLLGLLGWR